MKFTAVLLAAVAATTVAAEGFHLVTLHRRYRDQKQSDETPEFKGIKPTEVIPGATGKRATFMDRRSELVNRKEGGPEPPVTTTIHFEHERVAVFVPGNHFDCGTMLDKKYIMSTIKDKGDDADFTKFNGHLGYCGAQKLNFYQSGDKLQVFEDGKGTHYGDCYKGSQRGTCVENFFEKTNYSDTWVCPSFLCAKS